MPSGVDSGISVDWVVSIVVRGVDVVDRADGRARALVVAAAVVVGLLGLVVVERAPNIGVGVRVVVVVASVVVVVVSRIFEGCFFFCSTSSNLVAPLVLTNGGSFLVVVVVSVVVVVISVSGFYKKNKNKIREIWFHVKIKII